MLATAHDFRTRDCDDCMPLIIADIHSRTPTFQAMLAEVDRRAARMRPQRKPIGRGLQRAVWDRDGWECVECGSHRELTVDHIVPVSKGGTNDFGNLQTLCNDCNMKKGNRE